MLDRIPRTPAFAIACGVLMVLPTLAAGLFMDDALARVKLLGIDTPWSPAAWWDLFTFARADLNAELLAAGHHPWWADPAVRMTFFRPLSALTHIVDYALWPNSPALQHLHSVLWYGLAVGLATRIFRRVHPDAGRVAVVAGLAFAVAAPHALTVGWLAGRNTVIALVFSCLMIEAHLRWRGGEGRRFGVGAVVLLVVGLGSSEAMLGGLAYVAAWQLCLDRGAWRARLGALVPYLVVVVVWRVLYSAAGFGANATAIYHDPGTDPADFVSALFTHTPVLLLGRWVPIPLDFWSLISDSARMGVVGGALACIAGLGALFMPLLRSSGRARFWAMGMVLAVVPFTATVPMDRLTLFAGLGFAGLIGVLADAAFERPSTRRVRAAVLILHLPVAGILGLARASTLSVMLAANTGGAAQAPRDTAVPGQTFVYVASTFHRVHYTTLMRAAAGDPAVPRRSVVLSSIATGATLTRVDDRTLDVEQDGGFMALGVDQIHRRVSARFTVGQVIELPDVRIEVVELTPDGRPARARFRFHRPLEDPSLRWLVVAPVADGVMPLDVETRPFTLPGVGEAARLESAL